MSTFHVGSDGLTWGDQKAAPAELLGFHERFDVWRGGLWLDVDGPGWSIPVGDDYGEVRRRLRALYADRPFTSDWSLAGRFPGLIAGLPPGPIWSVLVAVGLAASFGLGLSAEGALLAVGALALVWALGSWRVSAWIDPLGLRLGPVWTPRVPWHEVEEVGAEPEGASGWRVVAVTRDGVQEVVLPRVLAPAFRARLWRLGGLRVQPGLPPLEQMYLRWRAAARGVPGGLFAVTCVGAWMSANPFPVLTAGLWLTSIAALIGAAVEARASGWRQGGIVWMTGAWALVLLGLLLSGLSVGR